MPKALSLKKVPHKNQKPITQFFQNANFVSKHNNKSTPAKISKSLSSVVENESLKRKAATQSIAQTFEITGVQADNNNDLTRVDGDGQHTPKRFKSEQSSLSLCSKVGTKKKSPCKENGTAELVCKDSSTIVLDKDKHDDSNSKIDRSALTPVKILDNGEIINHLDINKAKSNYELKSNENHVTERVLTPSKAFNFGNCNDYEHGIKKKTTPKKTPAKADRLQKLLCTPEKLRNNELSPSKNGSTVKTIEFSPGTLDGFGDQWDEGLLDEDSREDLDLTMMQRCEVLSVTQHQHKLELRLKSDTDHRGTCLVEGVWLHTPLVPGEIISVIAGRNSTGQFCVNNECGLISLRPDHLVSSTSVVAGVFCKRKALLQERFRGIDSGNTAMTIGILIHELVQKALTQNIMDVSKLLNEIDDLIKVSLQMLYDAGISEAEAKSNMLIYLQPLADFMQTYVSKSPLSKPPQKDQWIGHIDKVLDIEENMCCPQLGLKGKIDATLQVTIHEREGRKKAIVPLELKSGKASMSAEHRGQLVLYGMMLSLLRNEDPTAAENRGLLLYLKERVDVREVNCGYPERRDLMMLRNQLVQYLTSGPQDLDSEQIKDIEDTCVVQQKLPEPVHHHNACNRCPYLTVCSLHLWYTEGPSVEADHPLSKLREQALGHLTQKHIEYFLHWAALLRIEERGQITVSPLHTLWTDSAEKRSKRGTCASNLKLKSVVATGDRYLHLFERQTKAIDSLSYKNPKGPQEGEFSIVSVDGRPWIAAGVVTLANETDIQILLERDLSRRLDKDTGYHIDTYESYATTVHNLTNLGVLIDDTERSVRLRRLIVDKEPPEFEKKLPREVGRLGSKLMRSLNIEQQRAVLKALAAKDYALLQGLPGTGKTQTISVLIQMLVGLKQRVLVTAHTHSAVDNVLSRLPETLKVMRLGSSARVAPTLLNRCEHNLVVKCESAKELEELYESMDVVGVTCLGANHALLSRTTFDICIVDEATQVLQSTVLRPLFAAKRFLLVGDPDQLPPVVRSRAARRLGMEESLFHRLMCQEATTTLQLQYRMNQPLADLANIVAYGNKLKCADKSIADGKINIDTSKLSEEPSWIQTACGSDPKQAALFIDTVTTNFVELSTKSCSNVLEACIVMALVEALVKGGMKPIEIGVIAPYRDQVSMLRQPLVSRGVECSTVDQFQGRDKSVIIFSCTKHDGQGDRKIKEGEILNDQRRLAVSVTRAKHKLLVIGNFRSLLKYAPIKRLMEACTTLPLDKNTLDNLANKYKKQFL